MSGAVPLLPHYAFMAWIKQLSLHRIPQWKAVISHVCSNDARVLKVSHSGVTTGKECKSGLKLQ